jgi:hypothetical protein
MAIAYLGDGNGGTSVGLSHSASVTIPSGTDLFVVVAYHNALDVDSPTAPDAGTVNGVAMTLAGTRPTGDQNSGRGSLLFILSPATGSQTVAVSGATATSGPNITGFLWVALSGAKQSGQPDSYGKVDLTTTAALAVATTVVETGCVLVGGVINQGAAPTSVTNGTLREYGVPDGGYGIADSVGNSIGTGSQALTFNQTNQLCSGVVASFSPAPASIPLLTLLGVGT